MAGRLLQIPLLMAALVIGGWAARYAFSQGMHTVVASEKATPLVSVQSPSIGPLPGCGLDSHMQYENPLRCRMEMRQAAAAGTRDGDNRLVFHAPDPPVTMNKAESKTAAGWFTAAMIAIPLSLLLAGAAGFLVYCSVGKKNDTWG